MRKAEHYQEARAPCCRATHEGYGGANFWAKYFNRRHESSKWLKPYSGNFQNMSLSCMLGLAGGFRVPVVCRRLGARWVVPFFGFVRRSVFAPCSSPPLSACLPFVGVRRLPVRVLCPISLSTLIRGSRSNRQLATTVFRLFFGFRLPSIVESPPCALYAEASFAEDGGLGIGCRSKLRLEIFTKRMYYCWSQCSAECATCADR